MNICKKCQSQTKNAKFCSKSCAASFNNIGVRRHGKEPIPCKNCGIMVTRKGSVTCSHLCSKEYRRKEYIRKWFSGEIKGDHKNKFRVPKPIREYLFAKYNNKCSICGWGEINPYTKTKSPPLQIEHKDGDYKNNRPENLDLICPNCHSLTSTYMALNKGKGRPQRDRIS